MARHFTAASSETLNTSLGAGGSLTGAITLAAILKRSSNGALNVFSVGTAGATRRALAFNAGDAFQLRSNNAQTGNNAVTVAAADGWACIAISKAAGTATPRVHKYLYSTNTWTHANAGATLGDSTPTANVALGSAGSSLFYDGDLAVAGSWAANLTDAQVEPLAFSLPAWFQVSPNGLWVLDQSSTAMLVNDLTGNGANQSSITGTSVATSNVPVFSYGHPIVVVPLPGGALAQITDSDTGTGADAGESIAAAVTDPDTGSGADAGESIAAGATDADTATAADAGESLAAATTDTEAGTAADAEALTVATTDPDTGTVTETEAIAAALSDAETGLGAESESVTVAVSDSDSAVVADAEAILAAALTDAEAAVVAEAEAIVAAVLDADDGTGTEAGTVVEHPVGVPGCMTLTVADLGTLGLSIADLGVLSLSIGDAPQSVALSVADLGTITLALSDVGALTITIEECGDVTPATGEARVTVTGEERVTTTDETRVTA